MDVASAPSAIDLIIGSGPIVKLVIILLFFASVASWAVIFLKWMSFRQARSESSKFIEMFWSAQSLDKIFHDSKNFSSSPVSNIFRAGYVEFQKVTTKGKEVGKNMGDLSSTTLDNVQRTLRKASLVETLRLETMIPILATVASVSPFVGLFGTVWGIMDSFQALGIGGPATIQRVAPGISEALIATAIGLAAAIPAVIFYNMFVNKIRGFKIDMDNFSSDFANILERNYLG